MRAASKLTSFLSRNKLLLIFGFVYFIFSLYALTSLLQNSRLGDRYYRATFEGMYNGTAWRPFVYRVLIPRLTNIITDTTPISMQRFVNDEIEEYIRDRDNTVIRTILPAVEDVYPDKTRHYPRLIMTLLIYGCLWGTVIMMYKLGKHLFPEDGAIRWFAPIPAMLIIPAMNWKMIYIYDPAVLFLSAACYYCMATRQFHLYAVAFTFACLNKESAIFIMLFFILWFSTRLNRKTFIFLVLLQIVLYAAIRFLLLLSFKENPGGVFEEYLGAMINFEFYPKTMYHRLVTVSVICFLLTYDWGKKPLFLKYILWMWPPMYGAYLMYGWPGEYRVFHDIMPPTLLLGVYTLVASTGISGARIFREGLLQEASRGKSDERMD